MLLCVEKSQTEGPIPVALCRVCQLRCSACNCDYFDVRCAQAVSAERRRRRRQQDSGESSKGAAADTLDHSGPSSRASASRSHPARRHRRSEDATGDSRPRRSSRAPPGEAGESRSHSRTQRSMQDEQVLSMLSSRDAWPELAAVDSIPATGGPLPPLAATSPLPHTNSTTTSYMTATGPRLEPLLSASQQQDSVFVEDTTRFKKHRRPVQGSSGTLPPQASVTHLLPQTTGAGRGMAAASSSPIAAAAAERSGYEREIFLWTEPLLSTMPSLALGFAVCNLYVVRKLKFLSNENLVQTYTSLAMASNALTYFLLAGALAYAWDQSSPRAGRKPSLWHLVAAYTFLLALILSLVMYSTDLRMDYYGIDPTLWSDFSDIGLWYNMALARFSAIFVAWLCLLSPIPQQLASTQIHPSAPSSAVPMHQSLHLGGNSAASRV
eukprot:m.215007 g.215007  ORF g.215007 m.215007 type:complete len:438 (+) comp10774_c0_seq7:150-1463(+)